MARGFTALTVVACCVAALATAASAGAAAAPWKHLPAVHAAE